MHPAGVVKPDDPETFLVAGGLVCDAHGNGFANMPSGRKYVSGEMRKNKLNRLGGTQRCGAT